MKTAKEIYLKFYHLDEQMELTNSDIEIIDCMQNFADQFQSKQSLTDITDIDKYLAELADDHANRTVGALKNSNINHWNDARYSYVQGFKKCFQTKEPKEVDPVKFLEWVGKNDYKLCQYGWFIERKGFHTQDVNKIITTAELLEIYKQSLIQE